MKKQFKKEVDKSTRSGTGRREKWRYFDDMEAICGHRDNITPTVLQESSKDNDHSDHQRVNLLMILKVAKLVRMSVCGLFSVMETLDGRSCIFLIPRPYF